jgi:hypothetical protein
MLDSWKNQLPSEYSNQVIRPVAFERNTEPSVNADKIIGFDAQGKPCFYYHTYTLTEEGFDIDEFPILINVYFEQVAAWRILDGQWVKMKSYSDKMDSCKQHLVTLPVELTDSMPR